VLEVAGRVVSPKFARKVKYVGTLSELAEYVPITQVAHRPRRLSPPSFIIPRLSLSMGIEAYGSFAFRWPCICIILRMKKILFYPPPTILLKLNSLAPIYRPS